MKKCLILMLMSILISSCSNPTNPTQRALEWLQFKDDCKEVINKLEGSFISIDKREDYSEFFCKFNVVLESIIFTFRLNEDSLHTASLLLDAKESIDRERSNENTDS